MLPAARPTVSLVAARAGVSPASVSRVLNGRPASGRVAEAVRAAARDLGYVPDARARSLKIGRTEQLALAVADVGNPAYVAMMRGVEAVLKAARYRLVLCSIGSAEDEELDLLRSLRRGFVDGLILSPLRITAALLAELAAPAVPVVVVGTIPKGVPVDNVRIDSVRGVGLAVRHLAAGGRQRVALVNGPVDTVPGAARQRGWDRALRALGRPRTAAAQATATDFTVAAGAEAGARLLDAYQADAVMCANDLLALGVLRALSDRGLRVPQDVAVVGMDDTDLAPLISPPLTSVQLGAQDRGRLAAELMLDRLRHPDTDPRRVTVAPRLCVRASSAPLEPATALRRESR